jgi:hypothetical protein
MKKWNQQHHDKFKAFALIHKVWDQKNLEKAWKDGAGFAFFNVG